MKPAWVLHGSVWGHARAHVRATHESHTGHVRATHESHTGHVRAHTGTARVVVLLFQTCYAVRMGPHAPHIAPTCALQIPYGWRFAIPWSKYRRHMHGTLRKLVDHVTTTPQKANSRYGLHTGHGPVRPSKFHGPVTARKCHVTVAFPIIYGIQFHNRNNCTNIISFTSQIHNQSN